MDKTDSDIEHQITHLIGRVAVVWNSTELTLQQLIVEYLDLIDNVGWLIVENMGNKTRCNILRAAVEELEKSEEAKECLLYAVKLFDRCRENRNQLLHSICDIQDGEVTLLKLNKGLGDNLHMLDADWKTLEETYQAISTTEEYINHLLFFVRFRRDGSQEPLPQKPPIPNKLKSRPLHQKDDQPPPQSSQG
ncbi:MAG: hypothetical protein ISR48_06470 [Alphaproteobacteria bacterium]|nr:hypothetical protein [Alphaproteobacteria bacterium]